MARWCAQQVLVPLVCGSLLWGGGIAPVPAAAEVPQIGYPGLASGPEPVWHPGAPIPVPFPPDYLVGYRSDISSHDYGIYVAVIDQWNELAAQHPDLLAANRAIAVQTNNAAEKQPALVAKAHLDAAADKRGALYAVADGLGAEFGRHFREALAEHRLPKTEFLFGNGYLARAGGLASSVIVEKRLFGTGRPYIDMPEDIVRFDAPDQDFYPGTPGFPSGHTNKATWITTLLAMMLPEVGPQLLARGAESGYHRIVLGVHYPLDVIGGRMTGTAAAADRWNDPKMRGALLAAGEEIRQEIEWRAGRPLEELVRQDTPYQSTEAAVDTYTKRLTYGFENPVGDPAAPMIVPAAAPALLETRFPDLTYAQRAEVLRLTALPAGYPLDDQGPRGSWQRINLARAFASHPSVNPDGSVTVEKPRAR